jgi:cytoskeletal protein CcmA (bactofilin family)
VAIFGKTDSPQTQPPPADRAPASTPGAAAATVLGAGIRFVGELSGDEDVLIHGRLEGNVEVQRRVTVGTSGEVKGDIHGRSVVVGGRVVGQVRADEKAELLASASVQGNVQAPKVVIAEGAQLQGNVAMSTPAPVQKKAEEN